jgi:selenocysteine-specific elongation factor
LETGVARIAISPERWHIFVQSLLEQLAAFHAENPDLQGIGREKLRSLLQPRLSAPVFFVALEKMARGGELVLDGSFVRLTTHAVRLSPKDEVAWEEIAPRLGGDERFRPPRVRDIAAATGRPESDVRRLLKLASRMGCADEVARDHFFLRPAVHQMASILAEVAAQCDGGWFTAAQFRDRVANGRKVAIQILEFFDRHGVTLRRGDLRRVDPHRLDMFRPAMLPSGADGGESSLVGRSDFKSEWGSETVSGGFDSRSLPPAPAPGGSA